MPICMLVFPCLRRCQRGCGPHEDVLVKVDEEHPAGGEAGAVRAVVDGNDLEETGGWEHEQESFMVRASEGMQEIFLNLRCNHLLRACLPA